MANYPGALISYVFYCVEWKKYLVPPRRVLVPPVLVRTLCETLCAHLVCQPCAGKFLPTLCGGGSGRTRFAQGRRLKANSHILYIYYTNIIYKYYTFIIHILCMCMRPDSCSGTSEPSNLHNLAPRAATESFSGASESKFRALAFGNVYEA